MARFNKQSAVINRTVNLAGGEAFKESSKLELISILLTSFAQDQYYRSADDTFDTLINLINRIHDKKFIAKAAIYARTKFGMRSISHITAAELAEIDRHINSPNKWLKRFIEQVVHRPDDITEILAYFISKYGKLPKQLKRGMRYAFNKFDEYQLAKYRSENKEFKLIDAVNLCHPKPTSKNAEALKKLVNGALRSIDTWETKLTQAGQNAETDEQKEELKKEAWVSLIKERKIGYFALLRNLRNILEQAPEIIPDAIAMLTDKVLIKKSLILPFRFLVAINELSHVPQSRVFIGAVSQAVDVSCDNVPEFSGNTLVALDVSGSMSNIMPRASYRYVDIAALFAAALARKGNTDIIRFKGSASYANINPADSVLTIAKVLSDCSGGSTDFHSIFHCASVSYDRIIILSDMQGWDDYYVPTKTFTVWKDKYNCNPYVYSIDLAGYGSLQFPERNVYCLAGFSEKIFDLMKLLEQDRNAMINEIEKIEL